MDITKARIKGIYDGDSRTMSIKDILIDELKHPFITCIFCEWKYDAQ
jgi:hypothetical protein